MEVVSFNKCSPLSKNLHIRGTGNTVDADVKAAGVPVTDVATEEARWEGGGKVNLHRWTTFHQGQGCTTLLDLEFRKSAIAQF